MPALLCFCVNKGSAGRGLDCGDIAQSVKSFKSKATLMQIVYHKFRSLLSTYLSFTKTSRIVGKKKTLYLASKLTS